jgi:hypothetical protein
VLGLLERPRIVASPRGSPDTVPFRSDGERTAHPGSTYFDYAMLLVCRAVEAMDERRQVRLEQQVGRWAAKSPPPAKARTVDENTPPGDRFVAFLTTIAWRQARKHVQDPDELLELFCGAIEDGMARVVKYWGPGHKHPQKNVVEYAKGCVRSAVWNRSQSMHRRELPSRPIGGSDA